MSKNIKNLKPNRHSRYIQGYINPKSCKKLFPSIQNEPIIYRSSYERKFILWLENNKDVKYWGSECLKIPYTDFSGKEHIYYPDYVIEMNNGKTMVVEVKPKSQTMRPINENSWIYKEWVKNMLKWQKAIEFCKINGLEFKVITENTIEKL